ncbi:MAG: hypothetical protein KC441_07040 [Anaerolineales bacterium]|nr:hypothetical protein [Anaerolineales bacterium]
MRNPKEDANILNNYIDHGRSPDGPQPDVTARRVVDAMQQQISQINPDPHFVDQLSAQLQTEARQRPAPQSFADWLVLKFVPRLLWVGAAAAAVLLLVWGLPQLLQQQAGPEPVVQQPDITTGVVPEVVGDDTFALPQSPAQLPVYQIQLEPLPDSETAVLQWAQEFGLPDPQLFVDPRRPEGSAFIARSQDGQTITFAPPAAGGIQYQAGPFQAASGAPVPFAEAAATAQDFLRQHGMEEQMGTAVSENEMQRPYPGYPLRYVQFSPATGSYPLVTDWLSPGAVVAVGPVGQVQSASFFPATVQSQTTADIIPAQEVYDAFVSGDLQPFRLNTQGPNPFEEDLPYQVFSPPPAQHAVGDEIQVFGWVEALMSGDGGQKMATLYDGARDTAYELSGPQLDAFFAALSEAPMVTTYTVQGEITAQTGDHTWQVAIAAWEPGEPAYSSVSRYMCQVGAFSREAEESWFVDEATNGRYLLPDAPDALQEGERIEVCAPEFPPTEAPIRWDSITVPPASEAVTGPAAGPASINQIQTAVDSPLLSRTADAEPTAGAVPLPDSGYPGAANAYPVPASSYPAPAQSYPSLTAVESIPTGDKVPFEIGATADITGVLDATYFVQPDATRRLELVISLPDAAGLMGSGFPVIGDDAALKEAAEAYHGRFAHLTARVVTLPPETYGPDRTGFELISAQPAWTETAVKNYLGQIATEVIDGTDAVLFTDEATHQKYVVAWDDQRYFDGDYASAQSKILVQGIVMPGKTLGGLPLMWVKGSSTGVDVDQAANAEAFPSPLEPDVVQSPPFSGLEAPSQLIIERMTLVYFFDPAYEQMPPGQSGQQSLAAAQYLKPAWAIYGRIPTTNESFAAYFNAVKE